MQIEHVLKHAKTMNEWPMWTESVGDILPVKAMDAGSPAIPANPSATCRPSSLPHEVGWKVGRENRWVISMYVYDSLFIYIYIYRLDMSLKMQSLYREKNVVYELGECVKGLIQYFFTLWNAHQTEIRFRVHGTDRSVFIPHNSLQYNM